MTRQSPAADPTGVELRFRIFHLESAGGKVDSQYLSTPAVHVCFPICFGDFISLLAQCQTGFDYLIKPSLCIRLTIAFTKDLMMSELVPIVVVSEVAVQKSF
ncbi:MAG: hypothetical protein A4E66_02348 [Syntrophus sp. PtaB.Bin001]|nr:MAG: hypothetical protein A4E66_02348 [Syntrophus sp. PtaB.Bin001]